MIGERLCFAILFIAEALIAWGYCGRVFAPKKNGVMTVGVFLAGYIFLFIISGLSSVFLNTFLFFAVNATLMPVCYNCGIKTGILHAGLLTALMCITEVLVNSLLTIAFTGDYAAFQYNFTVMVTLSTVSKLLYFFVSFIFSGYLGHNKSQNNNLRLVLLLSATPFVSVIIITAFSYVGITSILSNSVETMIVVSVLSLLLLNIIVTVVYNQIRAIDAENMELQIGMIKERADASYYEMLQKKYEAQQILIHDIKNHFLAIGSLAANRDCDGIESYIKCLESAPEFKRKVRFCTDPILNMIITNHMDYCSNNGLEMYSDIRSGALSFLDAVSMTALFENLLSNAVEGAKQSMDKQIEVTVCKRAESDSTLISVINSCDNSPLFDAKGRLKTTKKSPSGHGLGTKSIERVVKMYGGEMKMYYDREDKRFHSIILFPCHTKANEK